MKAALCVKQTQLPLRQRRWIGRETERLVLFILTQDINTTHSRAVVIIYTC